MDDARRTTHDDGRQPIAIGHLSDSGDLKSFMKNTMSVLLITSTFFIEL